MPRHFEDWGKIVTGQGFELTLIPKDPDRVGTHRLREGVLATSSLWGWGHRAAHLNVIFQVPICN